MSHPPKPLPLAEMRARQAGSPTAHLARELAARTPLPEGAGAFNPAAAALALSWREQ